MSLKPARPSRYSNCPDRLINRSPDRCFSGVPRMSRSVTRSRQKARRGLLELLEPRTLLSSSPVGLTPAEVRHAYAFDQTLLTGAGQTIAVVDPYIAPTIYS